MAALDSSYATGSDTLTITAFWFKPVSDSTLNASLPISRWSQEEREMGQVHTGLGRDRPIVVADVMFGQDGEFEFTTTTSAQWASLAGVLRHQGAVYLQTPDGDDLYVHFIGNRQRQRVNTGSTARPLRVTRATYIEVDTPA